MKLNITIQMKVFLLVLMIIIYIIFAFFLRGLINLGYIQTLPPSPQYSVNSILEQNAYEVINLEQVENFVNNKLAESNGHINLDFIPSSSNATINNSNETNSEAVSYYLLWSAQSRYKNNFDSELDYMEKYMLTPQNYLRWRLEADDKAITDGNNIASDADLRTIKALLIAEKQWKDKRYTELINNMSNGLANLAVDNGTFVPYGGVHDDGSIWKADEIYLSYADFETLRVLAFRKGEPWISVDNNMKKDVIASQTSNGLYNSHLSNGVYSNFLQKYYSIDNLWVMVRAAESQDPELQNSSRKALNFYKTQFVENGKLSTGYDINGNSTNDESPWVYALVGRAAVALNDREFADVMMQKLLETQNEDQNSSLYGAFPEGDPNNPIASQFTQQESILTIQAYIGASTNLGA